MSAFLVVRDASRMGRPWYLAGVVGGNRPRQWSPEFGEAMRFQLEELADLLELVRAMKGRAVCIVAEGEVRSLCLRSLRRRYEVANGLNCD